MGCSACWASIQSALTFASEHPWCRNDLVTHTRLNYLFFWDKIRGIAGTTMLDEVGALVWKDISLKESDGVAKTSDLLSRIDTVITKIMWLMR
jgi:hypothetical protein